MMAALVMTAHEQLLIELINQARSDPAGEAARLGSNLSLNSGTCDGERLSISATPKQPLAPHQALINAAGDHADDMLARDYFSHTTLGSNKSPSERARDEGYPGGAGENISTYRQWPNDFTAQERINQVYDRHKSLYESPCHRINMFREQWEDVGVGVRFGEYTTPEHTWKASMVVENFGSAVGGQITGVVLDETKVNDTVHADQGVYNVGEGVGGVTITVTDANNRVVAQDQTGSSGGYSLSVPTAGVYTVIASGGPLSAPLETRNVRHRLDNFDNTKIDFDISLAPVDQADKVGVARVVNQQLRFLLDVNGDEKWVRGVDLDMGPFGIAGDVPLAGDWNNDGKDEIGVFRPKNNKFYLDTNGDFKFTTGVDQLFGPFGITGDQPLVGDWNGDGKDEIGVFRPRNQKFYLDVNGDGLFRATADRDFGPFGAAGDQPLVGDWNSDGKDETGVYRPANRRFYLDVNGDGAFSTTRGDVAQGPFGPAGATAVIGDWNDEDISRVGWFKEGAWRLDTDGPPGAFDASEKSFTFGQSGDRPVVGNWALSLVATHGDANGAVANLTADQLAPVVQQAVAWWSVVDLNAAQEAALRMVEVQIADLGPAQLGLAVANTILIDRNAAGYGWFVDQTPSLHEEFSQGRALAGSDAEGQVDLLSAVLHELGHVLGLDHNDGGMFESLTPGVRRLPAAIDAVFGEMSQGSP